MVTKPLTRAYIGEVRRRCEAATPAPWISYIEGRDHVSGDSFIGRGLNRSEEDLYLTGGTEADQEFIAHARQDVPLLIEEIERLLILLEECKSI